MAALWHLDRLLPGAPIVLLVAGTLLTYLVLLGAAAGVAAALYGYARATSHVTRHTSRASG